MMGIFITGCSENDDCLNRVLELRDIISASNSCSFTAEITADYTDGIYSFEMNCITDEDGNMTFEVKKPTEICGITGHVSENSCDLTFDGNVLAFPPLSDRLISPVCAPWVFMKALRGGYIRGCADDNDYLLAMIDDSYEDESLELRIWLDERDVPTDAEIIWNGSKIVTLRIGNFVCL